MKTKTAANTTALPCWLSLALLNLLLLASAQPSVAATVTWTGNGADINWTTPGNWSPGAPGANDILQFDGANQLAPNNNFTANTPFAGISFTPSAGAFVLGGNVINLGGLVQNNGGNVQTLGLPLNITDLTIFDSASGDLAASGAVSTLTNFFKDGPGRLDLYWDWFANATNNGTLTVSNGVVGINVGANSSNPNLQINYDPHVTLSGGSLELDYGSYWNQPIILFTTNSSVGVATGLRNDFAGTMGSPGYTWTKTGLGTLNTTFYVSNTPVVVQASAIVVAEGTLSDLPNNPAWDTTAIAQWGGTNVPITVAYGAALQKADCGFVPNPIELQGGDGTGNGNGVLYATRLNNGTTVYPTISFLNTITLDADSSIGSWYGKLVLAGPIIGAGGLTKVGPNPLVLAGTNSYAGATTINAGAVQLGSPSAIPTGATQGNVQLNGGTTLDLNGYNATVGSLNDDSTGAAALDNSSTNSAATLALGANDQAVVFTGAIKNTGNPLSIVKLGTGTATLLGANTYSGSNIVMGGSLELNLPSGASGAVAVADGATLTLHKMVGGAALRPTALTLGSAGATVLNLDLGGFGNPSLAIFNVTNGAGTLTVGGNVTINISGNGNVMSVGQFPLIKYLVRAGSGTFTLGTLPSLIVANLVNNTANKSIDLKITSAPITKWVGNLSADWDIATTMNWSLLGVASTYHDNIGVLFDDTAATNFVNLTTTVSPSGTLVNATTNYTFGGPGGIYAGDLTKAGSGTLTVLSPNGYNNTIISGGTVQVDTGGTTGALGSGNIEDDATLIFNRGDDYAIYGNITGVGTVIQQGTNTLTLSGANSYSGGTVINHGVVHLGASVGNQPGGSPALGAPAGSLPLVTVANGAALDMNGSRISTVNNPVIISGSGTGVDPNYGALYTAGSSYQWFGWGNPPTITNLQLAADAAIGGNANDWFEIGSHGGTFGGIDGKGHILTKVGSSTIILKQNAISALSQAVVAGGRLILTTSNPFGSGAVVVLTNNSAMDTWGDGNAGWNGVTVPNNFVIASNGGQVRNTQGAWYGHANYDTYQGAFTLNGMLTLQNTSTYSGSPNPAGVVTLGTMTFTGPISGPGSINKTGPNLVTFSGANTYTGATVVAAGTLAISSISQGHGDYTVADGATLDVPSQAGYTTVPMSSLTLGSSAGAALALSRQTSLSTSNAPITATNFTATGQNSILVPGFAFAAPGQYPLIKYIGTMAGGGTFIAGGLVRGVPGYISNNLANSSIDLVVPGDSPVTWVGNVNNTWDISTTANFTYHGAGTTYQQTGASGDAVAFDDTGLLTTVNLFTPVSPTLLVVSNVAKDYTFIGTNIAGITALLKEGSGRLTLSNAASTFTGGTFVSGGTVRLGNAGAVNAAGFVTVANGATLDINSYNPSGITINAAGSGVNGVGAIIDNSPYNGNNTQGPGTINMMGDLTVGGTNRWSLRNGAHTLNCPANGYSLIKVGTGMFDLSGAIVSPNLGDIVILQGIFSHRNANSTLGNPAKLIRVGAGATLNFNTTPPTSLKPIICTNGAIITIDSSGVTVGNPITLDSGTVSINLNFNNTASFTNVIGGAGGLRADYNSQITFTAPNTYTGNTEVRPGPAAGPAAYVKLSGVGAIANSANIILDGGGLANYAGGAILDASARTDGKLTLASGQTLRGDNGSSLKGNVVAGSGSTIWPGGPGYIQSMVFSNSLTFQAGSICALDVNKDTTTMDVIIVTSALTYGGTLQVNHLGTTAFAAGDSFKLFTAGSYAGNFASITPVTPGAGLAWDTSALATSGTLAIVAVPQLLPAFLDASRTHLVVQATNTMASRSYVLWATTNLSSPVVWVAVATNSPVNGVVSNAMPVTAVAPQTFYRYQMR